MNKVAKYLLRVGILLVLATPAFAETRTISWDPVTTYTDGTTIGSGSGTVSYLVYWSTTAGGTPVQIGTSVTTTSTTFDPDAQRMTRGSTVYFNMKAVLGTQQSAASAAFPWVVPVVAPSAATLSSISVSGPTSVNEGGTGTYTATATWSDASATSVAPTWSVSPTTYASISPSGVLTTLAVTANQTATVTASYTSGGVTRTATRAVTIVDVPAATPAAPKNFGISGPVSSVPTETWRLHWDSVTTKWDGTPIDSGRTVRYLTYWTDDPALSAGSLRQLGSPVSGTTLEFDPSANQMVKNQEVYLTVRAVLDTGEQSSLTAGIPWRASNEGPIPPARGKIYKK